MSSVVHIALLFGADSETFQLFISLRPSGLLVGFHKCRSQMVCTCDCEHARGAVL